MDSKPSSKDTNWQTELKKEDPSWVSVTHTCNPSYSGGRDQKDHGLKPSLGK
jgi:hypothetical protein